MSVLERGKFEKEIRFRERSVSERSISYVRSILERSISDEGEEGTYDNATERGESDLR